MTQFSFSPHSELSVHNKLLLYKQVLKPAWTYGYGVWYKNVMFRPVGPLNVRKNDALWCHCQDAE